MQHLEYKEQVALFAWAFYASEQYPCLKYLHASTAGEKFKSQMQAIRAKKAGMKAGVPDIFLPHPNKEFSGLFIELKRPIIKGKPKPTVSDKQHEWLLYLSSVGYKAIVCYGVREAICEIQKYINLK